MEEKGAAARDLRPAMPPSWAPVGTRWAVLVGISTYRDPTLNLQFADRDALELRDLLITPEGGGFDPAHVKLLTNEGATTAAVTQAVRGFLLQAVPDDLVVLFVACHGGPDMRRPSGPLYLYTHDTDRHDVAGTAFPMDDIDAALRQLIQARRVVIVADTCHSAAIGGARIRGDITAEATNRYLDAMAQAKGGVALLTSAEAAEASQEDQRWGGGHGVFTHHLLEGMRGAADGYGGGERDGIVSVGELFEYVRDQVQRDTDGTQHPSIGTTRFDRKLPMAVTGDLEFEQYLAMGRALVDVGWILDDPAAMLLAAHQFGLAKELGHAAPSTEFERGGALLAAGQADAAAELISSTIARFPDKVDASVWRDLGLAEAERGRNKAAAAALTRFLQAAKGHPEAVWIREYAKWLARPSGAIRALLIGVGTFPDPSTPGLAGVTNDLDLVAEVLRTSIGVREDHITLLQDADATLEGIRQSFDRLAAEIEPDEVAIVYFSGHSRATAGANEPFLAAYADHRKGVVGISPQELVTALDLPCREVVLILDTHISPALVALAGEQERIVALLGCAIDESAFETTVEGVNHGAFTAALATELRQGSDLTYSVLMERVRRRVRYDFGRRGQTPRVAGRRDGPVFCGHFEDAGLWRALRRDVPRATDEDALWRCAERGLPAAMWAQGRALLAANDPHRALAAFPGLDTAGLEQWALAADVAMAHIDAGQPLEARTAISTASAKLGGRNDEMLLTAAAILGGGTIQSPEIVVLAPLTTTAERFAVERAEELRRAAAVAAGRAATGLEYYGPGQATVAVMRSVLARLSSGSRPAVFVFAGSTTEAGGRFYELSDGLLSAREAAGIARDARHVVGLLELDVSSVLHRRLEPAPIAPEDFGVQIALLAKSREATVALLEALPTVWAQGYTFREWATLAGDSTPPDAYVLSTMHRIRGVPVAEHAAWMLARRWLVRARRSSAAAVEQSARAAISTRDAQRDPYPQGHLQLGLALAAEGRSDQAVGALRTARNLYDDPSVALSERLRDPMFDSGSREAHYHYGRLLSDHGDDIFDAVASLRMAARDAEDDPRIQLHLALALRALIERETLVEAQTHARRYLELGAPLGYALQLTDFVLPVAKEDVADEHAEQDHDPQQ